MKIFDARFVVACPGRDVVTLKIVTGVGDATRDGRELAARRPYRPAASPVGPLADGTMRSW